MIKLLFLLNSKTSIFKEGFGLPFPSFLLRYVKRLFFKVPIYDTLIIFVVYSKLLNGLFI